jgi:RNA-binding protein
MSATESALRGKAKKALRGAAHPLKPLVHVGDAGLTDGVRGALDTALSDHELVKVRLHEPDDKKALAQHIAESVHAQLCGIVGHTVILYRPHPENPRADLAQLARSD